MTTTAESRAMPYPPGAVLAGKYRIEKLLGEGGMGWVVLATHMHLEQRVALKFMRAEQVAEHPDAVARFLREARAAARIQSEHVARVSDVGTLDDGAPYLVMEYLEGQDLDELLQVQTRLPVEQAIDYALQACEGLAEAHAKGIVHRDLKPANLFLARRSDGSPRVKLLDFGFSKITSGSGGSDAGMTSTQTLMGSPLYMSPEQLRSTKNVDQRADLWSLGIILYEMLGARRPFDADTLPEICARIMAEPPPPLTGVRDELASVVMRCLQKDPQLRFQDVGALAMAIAPYGPPDSRTVAERIARVIRSSRASVPSLRPEASSSGSDALSAAASSGVARTDIGFGTVATTSNKRSSALPLLLGAGAGVAAGIVLVFLLLRGHRAAPDSSAVAPLPGAAPSVSSAPLPSTAAQAVELPLPSASAAAEDLATATVPSTAPAPAPSAPAVARPKLPAGPKPKPSASPKPPSANPFGGRD
jgi:serine/threonine-protein kinase